jgi:glycosyltransferase involved in cell wall biosynthesis
VIGDNEKYNLLFKELKCCVLIPTYNNAGTIASVIRDVIQYTDDVCVIVDGSTDNTIDILKGFDITRVHSYSTNKGKGYALRTGFDFARKQGYDYVITIDSDGQHFASDIPTFIEALKHKDNAIFIGARNMTVENVPTKSSFGNKFSNFWFKLETGIELPDTQSGYRLYPIKALEGMTFFTSKYEFEIEVIVRAAWAGIAVEALPIKVYYPSAHERVSHFRPFKDFSRISVLNTFLVLWTFLYIKPRNFIRLFPKKKISEIADIYLLRSHESPSVKAFSVALGIFFGLAPFWGFQMLLVVFFAWIFKLNKFVALVASNISVPPLIPFIIFLSYKFGGLIVVSNRIDFTFSSSVSIQDIHQNIWQYIVGSFLLAIIASFVAGLSAFIFVKMKKR